MLGKIHIFWEGHTSLQNLHHRCDRYYIRQIIVKISQNVLAFSEYMNFKNYVLLKYLLTLVCQIDVHARLLILGVKVQPTWAYLDLQAY